MKKFMAAAIQLDSTGDVDENLKIAGEYIAQAAQCGAKLIAMPENMNYVGAESAKFAEEIPGGKTFAFMSALAKEHKVWLHCGSIYECNPGDSRPFNATMVINPEGELVGKYHKLHPFDVSIHNGPTVKESDRICPGNEIVTVETGDVGTLGLSICYDMRFPELYRLLTLRGADILLVPADFTLNTGKDHWEVMLRARAIENGCYVIAPAQYGIKPKFQAYARTLIIDPWGNVIAKASDRPGFIMAEIDLEFMQKIRNQVCTIPNRRDDIYSLTEIN